MCLGVVAACLALAACTDDIDVPAGAAASRPEEEVVLVDDTTSSDATGDSTPGSDSSGDTVPPRPSFECDGDGECWEVGEYEHPTVGKVFFIISRRPDDCGTFFSEYRLTAVDESYGMVWDRVIPCLVGISPTDPLFDLSGNVMFAADSGGMGTDDYGFPYDGGLVVLVPTLDGFDDLGTATHSDGPGPVGPFSPAIAVDDDSDGVREIIAYADLDHSTYTVYRWDGQYYLPDQGG